MLSSYIKISNLIKVLKNEENENKDEIFRLQSLLYQEKEYFTNKLIDYLKEELDLEYTYHYINDINGNKAHILVRQASRIFEKNIEGKDLVQFEIEELIDKRRFDNTNEIIILDMNFDENYINLEYLCKSFDYYFISYSDSFKKRLEAFIDYILARNYSEPE